MHGLLTAYLREYLLQPEPLNYITQQQRARK